MGLFLFLLGASRRLVIVATILGALSGLASVALIAIVHRVLREPQESDYALVAFIALCVLILVSRVLAQMMLTRLSQNSISRLLMHLCDRILGAPLRHIEEIGAGRLYASLTADVATVGHALNGLPTAFVNAIVLIAAAAYLAWLSLPAFLAMLAFLLVGLVSYRLPSVAAHRSIRQAREHLDTLMRAIDALIGGVKELKIHGPRRQAFMTDMLMRADTRVREHNIRGFTLQSTAGAWGRLLFLIGIGVMVFAWPRFYPVDPATLMAYVLVILFMAAPLERIMAWMPLMGRARIALRKIQNLRLSLEDGESPADVTPLPASWGRLELHAVSYTYRRETDGHDFRLGPIDLEIVPGELVFVVGGNGSGKTTLAKLLTGLYVPDEGRVSIDGVPITSENRAAYRQRFSVVFADAPIFEGLIGLNRECLDANAQRYLEKLEINHKVSVQDGIFSTTDLSKGQKKRLALLTAYLEDRSIYVLDEWAADQDPEFRHIFYRELLPELKRRGKAVVAITHDDRYFDVADRIIVLSEGQIRTHTPDRGSTVLTEPGVVAW